VDAADMEERVVERVAASNPSVVVLDQITSATALRLPLETIIPAIRGASPDTRIVVDGAHAAGMEPQPVVTGADAWIANLHKWVCAAPGTAVIVADRGEDVGPILRGWAGSEPFPESHLWLGTDAKASYVAAPRATQILEGLRTAGLDRHISSTLGDVSRTLSDAWGVAPDARPPGMGAPWMTLMEIPGSHTVEWEQLDGMIRAVRDELKADVVMTVFGGTLYLRLSCHGYNTVEQYERLLGLPELVARLVRST
jgi:isopenicillin-N epimerase